MSARLLAGSLMVVLTSCGSSPVTDADASATADAAVYQGCGEDVPAFGLGMQAKGEDGRLTAKLVAADPSPPGRYLNSWTIDLLGADGALAADASISEARTFMPVHGHDGNVQPVITALDPTGRFQVDRLNLSMRGPWEIQLTLSSPSRGDDYAVFHVCVAE